MTRVKMLKERTISHVETYAASPFQPYLVRLEMCFLSKNLPKIRVNPIKMHLKMFFSAFLKNFKRS